MKATTIYNTNTLNKAIMKRFYLKKYFYILSILLASAFGSVNVNGQLFYQNFNGTAVANTANSAITTADYYTASGEANKFDVIQDGNHATSYININNATASYFQTTDAGSGFMWLMARTTDLAATAPTALKITFSGKFDVNSTGSTNCRFIFQVGDGFSSTFSTTNMAMKEADANVFMGFGLKASHSTNGPTLWQNNGTTQINAGVYVTDNTVATWTIVINNTGSSLNYTDPTTATSAVANDCFDIWIGTTLYGNDIPATTGTQSLQNFKMGSFTNSSSGRIHNFFDWIQIDDLSPSSTCTAPTTQVGAISFSGVSDSQMSVDLATPGNGDSILILAHSGSAVNSDPTDKTNYTASATFGSGTQIGTGNYVVFKGVDANLPVTVTGLSESTTYHFAAYAYNGCSGDSTFYKVNDETTNSQATTASCSAPTSEPDGTPSFSGTTQTATTWGTFSNDASADNTIVFCKEGGTTADNPVDGTAYTASTNWSSKGTQIGATGWYCVYKGSASGASVVMSNLSAGTAYYFKAYAYNDCSANPKFYTGATLAGNTTTTTCNAPTSEPDGTPSFSGTTQTATTWGTFSNDASSDNTIVFCRQGGTTADNPVDGTAYTASTNWSSKGTQIGATGWYCVYKGSASGASVVMSNLSSGTAYYFKAYAYNDCSSSPKFYTTATLAGNTTTTACVAPTAAPSGTPSFSSTTATSSTWGTFSNAADADNTIVFVKASSYTTDNPSDGTAYTASTTFGSGTQIGATGWYCVYKGSASGASVAVTGLSAGTTYYFKAYAYNDCSSSPKHYTTAILSGNVTTDNQVCSQIPSGAVNGGIYDFGDYSISCSTTGTSYTNDPVATSTSNLCNGAAKRYYTKNVVVYLGGSGATEILLQGQQAYNVQIASVYTADALGGSYSDYGAFTPVNYTSSACGTLGITGVNIAQGKYVLLSFTSGSIHEFRISGLCITAPSVPCSTPTTQVGAISFSNVSTTAMDLNLASFGDGDSILVLAHSGAAVNADPVDDTNYTANLAFGSGTQIGTGNYVVYKGVQADFPITITGLTESTTYHYAAYAYNGGCTGGPDYKVNDETTNSQATTACTDPTTQVGAISFASIGETQMNVNLASFGNGDSILIIAHSGAAVDADPVDNTDYVASATFGSGTQIGTGNYVVFKGVTADLAETITGLSASTTYHFAAYAYNDCSGNPKYKTDNETTNSQATAAPCVAPTSEPDGAPTFTGTSGNATTWGTFSNDASSDNTIIFCREASTTADNPVDGTAYTASTDWSAKGTQIGATGWYCVYKGSAAGASVAMTNLSSSTAYFFKAYAYNDCSSSPKFYTAATLAGNTTTSASTCNPRTVTFSGAYTNFVSGNGVTITKSTSNGSQTMTCINASSVQYTSLNGNTTYVIATLDDSSEKIDSIKLVWRAGAANQEVPIIFSSSAIAAPTTVSGVTEIATATNGGLILSPTIVSSSTNNCPGEIVTFPNNTVQSILLSRVVAYNSGTYSLDTEYPTFYGRINSTTTGYTTLVGAASSTYIGELSLYISCLTCEAPSTQVGAISISSIYDTQMDIDLASFGNGDSIMILAHSGSAVNADPVDDTHYSANASFGSGAEIGTGNYVIFKGVGADLPITVTGLSASTTYHFAAYGYKSCTGSPKYRSTDETTANQATTAACITPTSAPDGTPTFSGTTQTATTWGTFSNDASSSYTIVFCREGGTTADNPVDGTSYTASTNWSSKGTQIGATGWYCVYKGDALGASVAMSNLSVNTAYYFKAYAYNNCLSVAYYTGATLSGNTSTLPPNPEITVQLVSTNADVADDETINMGTVIGGTTIDKTFRIINTDDLDALTISSCVFTTGTKYAFVGANPTASSPLAAGDTLEFTVRFTPGGTTGTYTDILTITNNDNNEGTFTINLSGGKAAFTIPYKYESGLSTPIYKADTLYQDYTTLTDIPAEVSLNGGVAINADHFLAGYSVFQVEGNCMPNGSSALRVGQGASGLELDLNNCGTVTVKWCSNGYRKIKISDDASNVYEISPSYLIGGTCYTTSTVINTASAITLNIELIGPEAGTKGTIYYLEITPYDAAVQSSARNIVAFSTGEAGETVRIYDDVIFASVPSAVNLSSITPSTITTSAAASVSPLQGVTQDFSSGYVTYTVTAENGLTKTYQVFVEHEPTYTGTWEDSIAVTVNMDDADKLLEVLEISNTSCIVPTTGTGSAYTIYFLSDADLPVGGYTIGGLSQVCIGSTVCYSLTNAPVTNSPNYTWKLYGDSITLFTVLSADTTIVHGTGAGADIDTVYVTQSLEELCLVAPNDTVTASLSIQIEVEFDPNCEHVTGTTDFSIDVTLDAPPAVTGLVASCVNNGLLTVTANGAGSAATTYNWTIIPDQPIVSQNDSSIVLNIGSTTTDFGAEVITQNGCGVTPATDTLTIDYATTTSTWTGAVSTAWDNNDNWNGRVPTACTNVIIPNVNTGSVNYPIIGTSGVCHYITFQPGGAVKGLEKLTYERAFVQITCTRDHWYTLTAPLKQMFSGDYFFNGAPETYMKLFDTVSPDAIGPTTNYVGKFTRSFASLTEALTPGEGFAFKVSQKTWDYPNGSSNVATDKSITFPRMNTDSSLVTTYIPYSAYNGMPYPFQTKTVTKGDAAYRFALEKANRTWADTTITLTAGNHLIGNPVMTHLNIDGFLAASATLNNTIKLWTGSAYVTFDGTGSGTWSGGYTGAYLAPMQSFVVTSTGGNVTFDIDNAYFASNDDNLSALRSADTKANMLFVNATKEGITTSTVITNQATASNNYDNEDIYKLFTPLTEVSDVYTLADGYALDFNKFKNYPFTAPIGIKTLAYGQVKLDFSGAESFADADVYLINSLTGEQVNLKENSSYKIDLTPENAQGSLFVEFRKATVVTDNKNIGNTNDDVQIFTKEENTVRVISSSLNPIKEVTIMDEVGRVLVRNKNLNLSFHDTTLNNGSKVILVKVVTEKGVKYAKVLIK